ncbi:hypothetical protein [Priestia aryabhattai]
MDKENKNSINDVEDHLNKVSGNPTKINTSGVPKGIRIIGYFFITFFVLLILTAFLLQFLNKTLV